MKKQMRMLFKTTVLFLLLSHAIYASAFASKNIELNISKDETDSTLHYIDVTVNNKTLNGEKISIVVLKPKSPGDWKDSGYTLAELVTDWNETAPDFTKLATMVYSIDQTVISNGKATFELIIPEDAATGNYAIQVEVLGESFSKSNVNTFYVKHVGESFKSRILSTVNDTGMTTSVLDEMLEIADYTCSDTKKSRIVTVVNSEKPVGGFDTYEDVEKAIEVGKFICDVEKIDLLEVMPKDTFKSYLETLSVDEAKVNKYLSVYPTILNSVTGVSNVNTLDAMISKFDDIYLVCKVNISNRDNMDENLKEVKDELFDTTELKNIYIKYQGLEDEVQVQVNAKLCDGIPYGDLNTFCTNFKTVMQPYMSQGSGSGSGSGSGFGSGSGSGVSVSVGGKPVVEKSPDDTISQKNIFRDIDGVEWATEAIEVFTKRGIVSGFGDGTFRPNNEVTREEFVKLLVRTFELNETEEEKEFTDVNDGDWFEKEVKTATSCGVINGLPDGSFGVGRSLIRQDAAVMIYRAMSHKGIEVVGDETDFSDVAEISDYAREAINALFSKQIINGKDNNKFEPHSCITRAETVVLLYRIWLQL